MKPVEFKEVNKIYAKDQPEYIPLPVYKSNSTQGEVISCWKLTFFERIKLLIKGEIWISMMTFNKPLTPIFITTKKKEVILIENK